MISASEKCRRSSAQKASSILWWSTASFSAYRRPARSRGGQQIRALVVDRGDLGLGRPRMPGPGIAQGESVATGVEARNLDPHQLPQHRIDRALAAPAPRGGRRAPWNTARFRAYVRVLAELPVWRSASSQGVPDLVVDLVGCPAAPCLAILASSSSRVSGSLRSGMQAVTVISTRSSGEFSAATVTVVLAGLLAGKYFAYSSL